MKRLYSVMAVVLAAVMALAFAACAGGGGKPAATSAPESADKTAPAVTAPAETPKIEAEVYDTGLFTVKVPEGWTALPAYDILSDGEIDASAVYLVSAPDAVDINDYFFASDVMYILVEYTDPETVYAGPDSDEYIDVEEFTEDIDGAQWQGFYGRLVNPSVVLWREREDGSFVRAEIFNYPEGVLWSNDVRFILNGVNAD